MKRRAGYMILLMLLSMGEGPASLAAGMAVKIDTGRIRQAPAPLFRDPIYDGAADPVPVYQREKKEWWMLYTQRRANVPSADVAFCYGTCIGVAVSSDHGQHWSYKGALALEFEPGVNTFWAPDVIYDKGVYHMFVAYIRGVRDHWGGTARIVHYTSRNCWSWTFSDSLRLSSDHVIDPTFMKLPDGKWHVWYKDETRGSVTMTAESSDLLHWKVSDQPAIGGGAHEGPKIFRFRDWYWMVTDEWHGLRVYRSKDAVSWEKQGLVLDQDGVRPDDHPTGAHADVVVTGAQCYIFYFTHPGRKTHGTAELDKDGNYPYEQKRSSIQVAELAFRDGTLAAVRDEPFDFFMGEPGERAGSKAGTGVTTADGTIAREDWRKGAEDPKYIHRSMKSMTDIMVHDIYSPPVASRIYSYISAAGYEAARHGDGGYLGLAGQLHGLDAVTEPVAGEVYSYSLAAVQAILLTGKALVISEDSVETLRIRLLREMKGTGMPQDVYDRSLEYGKKLSQEILAWAAKDHYKETRALERYDVNDETGNWKPTPPSYMKAVEPHWSKMRTFVIDSAKQFIPHPPTDYSTEKGSRFYQDALEVFNAGSKLTEEQRYIANFWDCNPFKMNINGHLMFASKKISPGGHWMNITGVACRGAKADYVRSAAAYAAVSVVIADAFISCWDEKYRSKAIRPETYINQYIDPDWMPLLQTPPFPEYTSGHSVVSACASVMLTKLFGSAFAYTDSTEVEFGIPPRRFASFRKAAEEAAISRFYGGIHFMPAIQYGLEEGDRIGEYVAGRIVFRK